MICKVFRRFIECIRYPISSPRDVLFALGIEMESRDMNFYQFLKKIITRSPKKLYMWMPRDKVEKCFAEAYKKECFHRTTLISYYFVQGWLEFILEFDQSNNLRSLYVQHALLNSSQSVELELLDGIDGGEEVEIDSSSKKKSD